ncbi:MAG TPA: hypothetical protein DCM51_01035 [Actinobacteria bacterium]|nr:hypothetical protein [Actinomycetota bacterium]
MTIAGFDFSAPNLVLGLFTGFLYGLLAIGIVLVYRSSRFINFAHVAIGVFAASIFSAIVSRQGLPYWLMFPVGILFGALIASGVEAGFVRRIADAPRVLGTVVTLGLSQFLIVFGLVVNAKNASGRLFPKPPLPSFLTGIKVGQITVSPSFVTVLLLAPVVLLALSLFLKRSRYGLAIRAAADNPDAASLAGVSARRMVTLSWALAGAIAAFSVILIYPTINLPDKDFLGPSLLVFALAGAVIGRFQNLPITFFSAVAIGVIDQVLRSNQEQVGLSQLVLVIIVFAGLLLQPKLSSRRDEDRGEWNKLYPPQLPTGVARLFTVRLITPVISVAAIVISVLIGTTVSNQTATILTFAVGFTIVGLSVGILTGVAGQLSLGQFAYAAISGTVSVRVAVATGQFFLGLLAGVITGAVVATIVGIPALRLRGLALAVSTLAFAFATSAWFLQQEFLIGPTASGIKVPTVDFPGLDLSLPRNYFVFSLGFLVICFVLAANVRRTGFGRVLRALRDNENAARAFTIAAPIRKLQTFAVAGGLAAVGGIVIANSITTLTPDYFKGTFSVDVVSQTVLGGLGVLFGPAIGALYSRVPQLIQLPELVPSLLILLAVILIVLIPRGLGGLLVRMRNSGAFALARLQGVDPQEAIRIDEGETDESEDRRLRAIDLLPLKQNQGSDPFVGIDPAALPPILEVSGASRSFGGIRAVSGVDLAVRPGEILGIIGPNGAGKTTLFEIIAGFTAPDAGTIVFNGRDITGLTPEARAKLGLVRSFQAARLYPTMSVLETVMVAMERSAPTSVGLSLLGLPGPDRRKRDKAMQYLEVMGLDTLKAKPVGELSTGTRRMVEITCMLALDPKVLLLDEPAGGIAQSEGESLVQLLTGVNRDLGTTLVVVEHDLPLLFRLAQRVIAMELGAVIAEGAPDAVRNHPDVVRSYLGADMTAVERSGPFTAATPSA